MMVNIPDVVKNIIPRNISLDDIIVVGPAKPEEVISLKEIWRQRLNDAVMRNSMESKKISLAVLEIIDNNDSPEIYSFIKAKEKPRISILYDAKTNRVVMF